MKKIISFLLCALLLVVVARVISLRYQDHSEGLDEVQEWIEIGKEKIEEAAEYFSANLFEKEWDLEGDYDIDTEEWFDEGGNIYSGSLEYTSLSEGTVTDLTLQAAGCKVVVEITEEKDFYLSFNNLKKVQAYQKEESLFIRAVRDTSIDMDKEENLLKLYIPADILLESMVLELGAGSMQLEGLNVQELAISVEAGRLALDGMEAEEMTVSVGAGVVSMNQVHVRDADFSVGAGSLDMSGVISGDLEAECAAGNLRLNLEGDRKDYNYNLQCMAGNISLDGEKFSGVNEGVLMDHAAQRTVELKCTVGNIMIIFEKSRL